MTTRGLDITLNIRNFTQEINKFVAFSVGKKSSWYGCDGIK